MPASRPARSLSRGDPRRGGDVNPQQIQQMMKQAQQMQDRLQKQMAELTVEATAGGGMVTVTLNGAKQLQSRSRSIPRSCRRTTSRCCRT